MFAVTLLAQHVILLFPPLTSTRETVLLPLPHKPPSLAIAYDKLQINQAGTKFVRHPRFRAFPGENPFLWTWYMELVRLNFLEVKFGDPQRQYIF